MILPISGVVHSGSQLVNDRYSYLSGIGFALVGGAILRAGLGLWERGRLSTSTSGALAGAAILILLVLGGTTWVQTYAWRDPETLWRWAVDMDPTCSLCHGNLGAAISSGPTGKVRLDEAEGHLRRAIALRPDSPIPYFNLGNVLLVRKQYPDAELAFRKYGDLSPGSPQGLARLGLLAILRGDYAEAVSLLATARGAPAGLDPALGTPARLLVVAVDLVEDDAGALTLLGQALVEQGHPSEAVGALRRAAALDPANAPARVTLIQAYRESGHPDLARQEMEKLGSLAPATPGGALRPLTAR
jgi:Flp pilus assembly protein TadD